LKIKIPLEDLRRVIFEEPRKPNELILAIRGNSEDIFKISNFVEKLGYSETASYHKDLFSEDMKSIFRYEKKMGEVV
jgi:hypothetical protein